MEKIFDKVYSTLCQLRNKIGNKESDYSNFLTRELNNSYIMITYRDAPMNTLTIEGYKIDTIHVDNRMKMNIHGKYFYLKKDDMMGTIAAKAEVSGKSHEYDLDLLAGELSYQICTISKEKFMEVANEVMVYISKKID